MHVIASYQEEEGKNKNLETHPKSLKTYWTACIFEDIILKGMI